MRVFKMNSAEASCSPKFKNLKTCGRNSPKEIKEKIRKNYKEKVQNCRDMLLNRFRGTNKEADLHKTLTEMYQDLFGFTNSSVIKENEIEILEEIRQELVQEEVEWCMEEYEKSEMDIDWSALEQEDNVICPICQRTNLTLQNNSLSCQVCNYSIGTQKNLLDVKKAILNSLENHSSICNNEFQFALLCELNESHVYLICNSCTEFQIVV